MANRLHKGAQHHAPQPHVIGKVRTGIWRSKVSLVRIDQSGAAKLRTLQAQRDRSRLRVLLPRGLRYNVRLRSSASILNLELRPRRCGLGSAGPPPIGMRPLRLLTWSFGDRHGRG